LGVKPRPKYGSTENNYAQRYHNRNDTTGLANIDLLRHIFSLSYFFSEMDGVTVFLVVISF
jgi:hypothetical protein